MTPFTSHRSSRRPFGVTLVELLVVLAIIGILSGLVLVGVQQSRESARRTQCLANLKNIGVAIQSFQSERGRFPDGGATNGFSLHLTLLPWLERQDLFDAFDHTKGALHPHNEQLAFKYALSVYQCPSDQGGLGPYTNYLGNNGTGYAIHGQNGAFVIREVSPPISVNDFRRGMSQTAAVCETVIFGRSGAAKGAVRVTDRRLLGAGEFPEFVELCKRTPVGPTATTMGVPWSHGSLSLTLYNHVLTPNTRSCVNGGSVMFGLFSPSSYHNSGVNLLLADGSTRFIENSIERRVWVAMGSRN